MLIFMFATCEIVNVLMCNKERVFFISFKQVIILIVETIKIINQKHKTSLESRGREGAHITIIMEFALATTVPSYDSDYGNSLYKTLQSFQDCDLTHCIISKTTAKAVQKPPHVKHCIDSAPLNNFSMSHKIISCHL